MTSRFSTKKSGFHLPTHNFISNKYRNSHSWTQSTWSFLELQEWHSLYQTSWKICSCKSFFTSFDVTELQAMTGEGTGRIDYRRQQLPVHHLSTKRCGSPRQRPTCTCQHFSLDELVSSCFCSGLISSFDPLRRLRLLSNCGTVSSCASLSALLSWDVWWTTRNQNPRSSHHEWCR